MATYTTYKNLEKPLSTEKYNVGVANKNNDVIDSELHKLDLKNESQDNLLATKESLNEHVSDENNPHNVTKSQVGLDNVDNTSDLNKPVSIAQQTAINESLIQADQYTDRKIAELINGAPETLDTLKEVADAIEENETIVEALDAAIGTKVNKSDILKNIDAVNENISEGKLVDALVVKEVFQSVSNGKQLVASAITDKGVATEATDTFEVMAENIGNIQSENSDNDIVSPLTYRIEFQGVFTKSQNSFTDWYFPLKNIKKIILKDIILTGRYYDSTNTSTLDISMSLLYYNANGESNGMSGPISSLYINSTTLKRNTLNDKVIDMSDNNSKTIAGIKLYGGTGYNTNKDNIYHVTLAGDIELYF